MKRQTKTTAAGLTAVAPKQNTATARALAPIQQLIADEVADMLVNGGAGAITDRLITAAAQHAMWRWASALHGPQEQQEIMQRVDEFGDARFREFKADMIVAWREQRRAKADTRSPEPKTVAERIRANVLGILRDQFESFLAAATPEECRLLVEVFSDHESNNRGRDSYEELPLGKAFDYALGKAAPDWVMVPARLREQVDRYIGCLKAAEDRRPAA